MPVTPNSEHRTADAPYLAVVNPAAGHGRCGRMADEALGRLRAAGVDLTRVDSGAPGDATELVRAAWRQGRRRFIAVGGDGTSYEIVNGLFPATATAPLSGVAPAGGAEGATLGFLPLGTGNSFLRDFTVGGPEHALEALAAGRTRPCDVMRLTHRDGVLHYINLLSVGFTADVAALTNRRFKRLGELGYLLGVLVCLARLRRRAFPLRGDGDAEPDRRRCLFLAFSNSKFTGGKMMIAPQAETADGLVEYVRWGPIGRVGLVRNLHTLYDGTHLAHPLASRRGLRRVDFELDGPVDVMVDGEVFTLDCRSIEVLPSALSVVV